MPTITTKNPATNKEISTYELDSAALTALKIEKAQQAFEDWRNTDFEYRAGLMRKAADILEQNKDRYSETMTLEMGKTLQSAKAEVDKCAWVCRYYADHAAEFLAEESIPTEGSMSGIVYQPLGVVLAIMPWNYPMWQVFRFAAPALMAGNAGLLKHASNVPASALNIEEVFRLAGFPDGLFTTLLITSKDVTKVLNHETVKAATLTGSGLAGSAVASECGKLIKKTVLELGGSDAYLILEDADLELAAEHCTQSRLLNAGQSCIGAKRFVVVESVYEEFLDLFKSKMSAAVMGDPMKAVDLGPMARHDLRDELHDQVVLSVKKGAKLLIGGHIPDNPGAFYPPTILTDVAPGMPAYDEELFGPVAAVIKVADEEEAIRVANDSPFGLGACVFTKDLVRGAHIAKYKLDAGCCFVNQFVKSDPRLRLGGIKQSGYGRELSHLGIKEFVNAKTFFVK